MSNSLETVARLKELQSTLLNYARETVQAANTDPLRESSTQLWLKEAGDCGFENAPQSGYLLSQGQLPFSDWATAFTTAGKDLLGYRQVFMPGDEAMATWWNNQVPEVLMDASQDYAVHTLVVEPVESAAAFVSGAAKSAVGAFEFGGIIAIIVVVVILVLVLAIRVS